MVGAALACALANTPATASQRIALVETSKILTPQTPSPIPDLRVSAINPASANLFKAVGVWDKLNSSRSAPFTDMQVWDASGFGAIKFGSSTSGQSLGHIIENNQIQAALVDNLKQFESVQILSPCSITSITSNEKTNEWVTATTKDGRTLRTRLLVGADGGDSIVRKAAGISAVGWNYNQKGIVTVVEHEEQTRNTTAWQRFLPLGPIALLPMFGRYSSIVWSTTPARADTLLAMSDEDFFAELKHAFHTPIERSYGTFNPLAKSNSNSPVIPNIVRTVGPRAAFPFRWTHSSDYVRGRIVLIGDAAHTIHPLAGQGVNLGFGDVISLATHIIEGVETGQDVGSVPLLRKYERQRKYSNLGTMSAIDALKYLFDSSLMPVNLVRNLGLSLLNSVPIVKDQIAHLAMGNNLDVSKIGISR
eukprot:TRINITY_DN4302_c0_g1_i2.p1 TRINITY_DN4302_c0_g1~~TRINITY_DN4302_c0_g1_i2.p1  ORF type:complete len:420 (+),score=85.57 TRINITY_DN4302_c0_g1_i2:148-1407(+)